MNNRCKKLLILFVSLVFLSQLLLACNSEPGGELGLPPDSPQLTVVERNACLEFFWDDVDNAIVYKVYWSMREDFNTQSAAGSYQVNDTYFLHESLENGTTYYYAITAVNHAGESALSPIVSATPSAPPSKPMLVTISAADTALQVDWAAQTNVLSYVY